MGTRGKLGILVVENVHWWRDRCWNIVWMKLNHEKLYLCMSQWSNTKNIVPLKCICSNMRIKGIKYIKYSYTWDLFVTICLHFIVIQNSSFIISNLLSTEGYILRIFIHTIVYQKFIIILWLSTNMGDERVCIVLGFEIFK